MEPAVDADLAPSEWHPDIRWLLDYWSSLRPDGERVPSRRDVDPARMVPLLPGIWMLDVRREPFRLRYRLAGTAVVAAHGRELTGLWFDEAHGDLPPDFFDRYRRVVETRVPSWRRGAPYLDTSSRSIRVIENVVLPLAADGLTVDMLLCLTRIHGRAGEVRL